MRAPLRRRENEDTTAATPPEKRLAFAVLVQAVDDACLGDERAVEWLRQDNPGRDYWCGLVDYDPGYVWRKARAAIARPRPDGHRRIFTDDELNLAIQLRDATGTWNTAARALSTNRSVLGRAIRGTGFFRSRRGYRVVKGVYKLESEARP